MPNFSCKVFLSQLYGPRKCSDLPKEGLLETRQGKGSLKGQNVLKKSVKQDISRGMERGGQTKQPLWRGGGVWLAKWCKSHKVYIHSHLMLLLLFTNIFIHIQQLNLYSRDILIHI